MNKGKTNYRFQINCDPNMIVNTINGWLSENGFSFVNKYGEDMYYSYDSWYGNRGFQYTINNNEVNIYAWTIGLGKVFYMLDSGAVNNMAGDHYKSMLASLFERLNSININGYANNINTNYQNVNNVQDAGQIANTLNTETNANAEKLCEIGFWMSIAGLVLSFLGYVFGVIIYFFIFYFASQGLKTKKRNKAIASIIITIVSILLIVVQLV